MEMENSLITEKHKLGVFDILKEALSNSTKNIYFLLFTLTTSLPLFFFRVYYEIFLQRTLLEAIKILTPPPSYRNYNWPMPKHTTTLLGQDFLYKLMYLVLFYLVPLQLLELCTMVVTVHSASKVYTEEKPFTLKDMVLKSVNYKSLSQSFITLIYVILWSTCVVVPLIWYAANFYANDAFFTVLFGVAFLVVMFKYLEFSSVWNMGFVISILEENIRGVKAISLAFLLSRKDRKRQGRLLMLVFFVWEIGLRLGSLFGGCYEGGYGIFAQIGLSCVGNVIKWVACLVYFYDCEKQMLEKKVDEEVGRK